MPIVASSRGKTSDPRMVCASPAGPLPLIIQPVVESDLQDPSAAISRLHTKIQQAMLTSGAVVLRGFGIADIVQFKKIVEDFAQGAPLSYAGGASPRSWLADGVYTSTDYPPEMPLSLHNELSYCAEYPRTLFFFCAFEPFEGGETTLGDSRRILAGVGSEITDLLKSKGILYVRNLASDRSSPYSWEAAFETVDPKTVESICARQKADFEWAADRSVRVSFVGPATVIHPETGEETWFNQAEGFHSGDMQESDVRNRPRLEAYLGDGSAIPESILQRIRSVIEKETVRHRWQRGDIMIVDNLLAAHGRMPYSGARTIAVAMT